MMRRSVLSPVGRARQTRCAWFVSATDIAPSGIGYRRVAVSPVSVGELTGKLPVVSVHAGPTTQHFVGILLLIPH